MGATLSYLGYAPHQQPCPDSQDRVSQHLHQSLGPTLILDNEAAAPPSIVDLYTRLTALKKDLQIAQVGNTNKEAVIQYLLQSSISNARVKENTLELKEQILLLKTTIDRTNKEKEEIKDKLGKAEDTIFALSRRSVLDSRPQSTSTSFSSCSDSPHKSEAVTEDLIDLLGCSQESDSAKLTEEDTTLLDGFYEDESDIKEVFKNTTPDQSLHQLSDSEFEGSSYIFHFPDSDETTEMQDAVKVSTEKVWVPHGLSDAIIPPQKQNNIPALSENSDNSSPDDASSSGGLNSAAVSFSSTDSEVPPLDDVRAKFLDEGFLQLKALQSKGGCLGTSMAIISEMADKVSSFAARSEARPSRKIAQVHTQAEDLQTSIGHNTLGPRWSIKETFDSARDRETASSINRSSAQAGARDTPYPDFFKYGIRYVPKNYEQNTYRTVVISGFSPNVTMKDLLGKVRGGMLVDAKILDTGNITGSNTALVTFVHERSARAYKDHAAKHPITFSDVVAQVAVVSTPTWPIPANIRAAIEDFGHTRCFEVHNVPRNLVLQNVRQELKASPVMKSDSLECMRLGADGVLGLRFSSIRAAGNSSNLFKTFRYRGCTVQSIPDPCAQPLETLLEPTDMSAVVQKHTPEPSDIFETETAAAGKYHRLTEFGRNIDPEFYRSQGLEHRADSLNVPGDEDGLLS